jgi:hypothetical protein
LVAGSAWVRAWNAPRPFIVRRAGVNWSVDLTRDHPGRVSAIGGTGGDLWAFPTAPPVEFAEVWRFTSLHRSC